MSDCIVEGGVAEIYVEAPAVQELSDGDDEVPGDDGSDFEDEVEEIGEAEADSDEAEAVMVVSESREQISKQIKALNDFYRSPSKKGKEIVQSLGPAAEKDEAAKKDKESSSSDSEYMPGDSCSSEEDEEAAHILKKFREFKRKLRSGVVAQLDDVVLEGPTALPEGYVDIEDDGNETPYVNSDDEESVEEVGSDGELRRKDSKYKMPWFFSKMTGHNRSTCEKRNGGGSSVGGHSSTSAAQPATSPNAMVLLSGTQKSSTNTRKRKAITGGSQDSLQTTTSRQKATSTPQNMINSSAKARVSTGAGGSATVNLRAHVPNSQATSSVTINITSGKATAQVSANEPATMKPPPHRAAAGPNLLLPPWDSTKL